MIKNDLQRQHPPSIYKELYLNRNKFKVFIFKINAFNQP